jgi:predicted AAA+ superfamily ATPase
MAAFPPWGSSTLHWIPLCTPGGSLENLVRLFMEQHQHPAAGQYWILSDEVQYLKDWEVYLKSLVDTYPHIRFMARGSAAAALRMKIRKSGAGGFNEFVLPPLSFAEYLRFAGRDESLISEREDEAGAPPVTSPPTSTASTTNFSVTGTSAAFPEAVASAAVRADPVRFLRQDIIDKVLLKDLPSLPAAAGAGLARTQRLRPCQPRSRLPRRVGAF